MNINKHVYFIRHGESVANVTQIRMGPDAPLTDRGRTQAKALRKRLALLPIERIVASDFVRAHDTAEIATAHLTEHLPIERSPLFGERRNPSFMLGQHLENPDHLRVWEIIGANYGNSGWRHSDEENFEDLIARATAALAYLVALPEVHIAVFSHGMFMKVILAHVLIGAHLNGRIFWDQFIPAKNVENTGIMHLEFTQNFHKTAMYWKLISWNDHAHLANVHP
jgi:broad specificity phosphatase PhoE